MHRSQLLTPLAVGIGAALVLTTQTSAAPAQPAAPHPKAAKASPTPYLLSTVGYASRVIGGKLPAGSGQTAFSVIGCNNRAGIDRSNAKADVTLPGGLALSSVKTRTWTSKTGNTVSSHTGSTSRRSRWRIPRWDRCTSRRSSRPRAPGTTAPASTPPPARTSPTSSSTRSSRRRSTSACHCPERASPFPALPRSRSGSAPRPPTPVERAQRWMPSRCG